MYEHHKQPLAKRAVFAKRLALNGIIGLILLVFSLGIGMVGYHFLEGLSWIDSLLNASMILGGMGLDGLAGWGRRKEFFTGAIDRFDQVKPGDKDYFAVQFMKSTRVDRIAARLVLESNLDTQPEALGVLSMATLVVCGEQDQDNGSAEKLADVLPDARLMIVPGTHMSSVTFADLGIAMRDFLIGTVVP